MAARVVSFGQDDCHRLAVLRLAGYFVAEAADLPELLAHLRSAAGWDAVLISEDEETVPAGVLETVRLESSLPVILFRRTHRELDERGFARVLQCLEPPEKWLRELALVIAQKGSLPRAAD